MGVRPLSVTVVAEPLHDEMVVEPPRYTCTPTSPRRYQFCDSAFPALPLVSVLPVPTPTPWSRGIVQFNVMDVVLAGVTLEKLGLTGG